MPLPTPLADLFAALALTLTLVEHPPLRTVADAHAHWDDLPGLAVKNLFLKDAGGQFWLVVVPADISVDTKALAGAIGSRRLSFGSAEALTTILGVEPGAVTPLAMINDRDHQVRLVVHAQLAAAGAVLVHPLVNTATLIMSPDDLERVLAARGVEAAWIDLTGVFR